MCGVVTALRVWVWPRLLAPWSSALRVVPAETWAVSVHPASREQVPESSVIITSSRSPLVPSVFTAVEKEAGNENFLRPMYFSF